MENITMKVIGDKLILEIDLTKPGVLSSTGKSFLIATSRGPVPVNYKLRPVKVAVNVMVPA